MNPQQLGYQLRNNELLNIATEEPFNTFNINVLQNNNPMKYFSQNVAILKLYVDVSNVELTDLYKKHCAQHNKQILTDLYPNSGFDIFTPDMVGFQEDFGVKMVNNRIKGEMLYYDVTNINRPIVSSPYIMYPRSSISKTPLTLANNAGIIDAGYRGWLIGAFRSSKIPTNDQLYIVDKHTRLLQICHPSLCPVFVVMVNEADLTDTTRGAGGFGSTGIVG
jgi:dUTP pyrophosphatase